MYFQGPSQDYLRQNGVVAACGMTWCWGFGVGSTWRYSFYASDFGSIG